MRTGMENTCMSINLVILGSLKKINSMDMGMRCGIMGLNMKECIEKD